MLQLIKCHLLNLHTNDCWIVERDTNKIIAMCPYCRKLVIMDNKGNWRRIQ